MLPEYQTSPGTEPGGVGTYANIGTLGGYAEQLPGPGLPGPASSGMASGGEFSAGNASARKKGRRRVSSSLPLSTSTATASSGLFSLSSPPSDAARAFPQDKSSSL